MIGTIGDILIGELRNKLASASGGRNFVETVCLSSIRTEKPVELDPSLRRF
jgi:hypothetical protein